MLIQNEREALFLACAMERGAVQLYKRTLMLMERLGRKEERLYCCLERMLSEETEHLRQFTELYDGLDASDERRIELAAVAEGLLFEGGLMEASREGLLADSERMLALARKAEAASAQKYREFAALARSEGARKALMMIAAQEEKHLAELNCMC